MKDMKRPNAITMHMFECDKTAELARNTSAMKQNQAAVNKFTQFIYKEANKSSIKIILQNEKSILKNDLTNATRSDEINSLKAGVKRIDISLNALHGITTYDAFSKHLNATSSKDLDSRGLPKDGFRKEIAAQITSLKNNLRDNKQDYLKDFIEARCDALKTSLSLYISIQHKRMQQFCKENPEHTHAINYLSKPLNQSLLKNQLQREQADVAKSKAPER